MTTTGISVNAEELPGGLTHPYESRDRTATYVCEHTFTWSPGDRWIAVQQGRVANAQQRCVVINDPLPHIPMQLGRQPVIAAIEAPDGDWRNDPAGVTTQLNAAATNWASRHGGR